MQLFYMEKERIVARARRARQTALLIRLSPDGRSLGVYQSPKATAEGNWSVTQGEIQASDLHTSLRFARHPAEATAMRELYEELGVVQGMQDFFYLGSVRDCVARNHALGVADYHIVGCVAHDWKVVPNTAEVLKFMWQDVLGCMAALQKEGSFMSPQKSSIVSRALREIALDWDHFGSTLSRVSWRGRIIGDTNPATAFA